jgi:hypothetical protein
VVVKIVLVQAVQATLVALVVLLPQQASQVAVFLLQAAAAVVLSLEIPLAVREELMLAMAVVWVPSMGKVLLLTVVAAAVRAGTKLQAGVQAEATAAPVLS